MGGYFAQLLNKFIFRMGGDGLRGGANFQEFKSLCLKGGLEFTVKKGTPAQYYWGPMKI